MAKTQVITYTNFFKNFSEGGRKKWPWAAVFKTDRLSLPFSGRAEAVAAWRDAEAEATVVEMVTAVAVADTVIVIVPTERRSDRRPQKLGVRAVLIEKVNKAEEKRGREMNYRDLK